MWGGRSHTGAVKGGAAPPGKGNSNGDGRPPPGAGAAGKLSITPALVDDSMSQDREDRGGQGVALSPLPPPRPWKVPGGGGSDAQPAPRKGSSAAGGGGDIWRVPGDDRREGGVVGKGPLPGGVAQSGSSLERRDPRSFSPRVEPAAGAPYGLGNDRGGDGPGDGYNSGGGGGGGNNIEDARSGTSASAALRGAGMGAEARGQDGRAAAGVAGEVRGGGKAAVAADGSGRPANIIRIRIPPASGQQAKATGRPSEANRFSNEKDLKPARSSGSGSGSGSGSHPAPGGRIGTTLSLGGGRTSPSSGDGGGGFDGDGGGDGGVGGGGGGDGGDGGGVGGSSGGDAVAEVFERDDESFGEGVSMFPGKTGRRKKNPVPTRAGGRNRTP